MTSHADKTNRIKSRASPPVAGMLLKIAEGGNARARERGGALLRRSTMRQQSQPDVSDTQRILDACGPRHRTARVVRAVRRSRFHVLSPAGGEGMKTGIQDAVTLASVLTEVSKAGYGDTTVRDAISGYATRRRRMALELLELRNRPTDSAERSDGTVNTGP